LSEVHKLCIELPRNAYKGLEALSAVMASRPEEIATKIIENYLGLIARISDYYRFRYDEVPKKTLDIVKTAIDEGRIKTRRKRLDLEVAEELAKTLGIIVTVVKEVYNSIPHEVNLEELGRSEKFAEAMKKAYGRSYGISTFLRRINKWRDLLEAFGITIDYRDGKPEKLKVAEPLMLDQYYYMYVPTALRKMRSKMKTRRVL